MEESFNTEKRNVNNQRATERDDKLQNTLTLKLKRVETTLKEFQLLHFHVNSARIFFNVSIKESLCTIIDETFHRLTPSRQGWTMTQRARFPEIVCHECNKCDYKDKATWKSNLSTHMKSRHEGVKFPCYQCDYSATSKDNLLAHIKSRHDVV